MAHEGYVDATSNTEIRGWVFDDSSPNESLVVEILSAGRVVATMRADQYRADLENAGKGNGAHAFSYKIKSGPSAEPLAARVVGKRWIVPPAGGLLPVSMRFDRYLAHSLEFGIPKLEGAFSTTEAGPDEGIFVARIIEAYHRAIGDDPNLKDRKADVWSEVGNIYHSEILSLLRKKDAIGVAGYLREAHAKGLTFGISQGKDTTATLRDRADARQNVLLQQMDRLVSLAEFLGVLDVESPEQHGQWGENFHSDPEVLVEKIGAAIGIPVVTPQVMGSYFGLKTKSGVVSGRDASALYAALRLKAIASDLDLKSPDICEIGGGLGTVAYYASRLGLNRYTIIDLPLINVLEAYTLFRSLPGARISLYGEGDEATADIRLLPTYCFARADRQYDILLNQDSMPEMHPDYSVGYLQQAWTNVKHAFLSINQEARAPGHGAVRQTVVRELVKQAGGFRMISRNRHWLQAGYVEEVYLAKR